MAALSSGNQFGARIGDGEQVVDGYGAAVRRKHQGMQRQGIPAGGTRPFGWLTDRRTLDPVESELIRSAARRFLAEAPHAVRILSRAWLRVIHACWRHQIPYDPASHRVNTAPA